ncbi:MAG TPA: heavy-metal-associated domain-containing protein [Sphingomicrobium sp.]|nr:heavy-metal-associated domain-containing protein [Sphingomicrobium sp.]
MPSQRRTALILIGALTALATGGTLVAQLEAGERGILPIDSSGTLEIGGIRVDVAGENSASARYAGWRIAQREGFKALWAKTNKRPIGEAPTLADSTLDGLVASIIVEREQIGPNRYIAELGILFDRTRAGGLLGVAGVQRRSEPMLLIPITVTAGNATSVELRNSWQRAWAQYRTSQSAIDYVRVSGMGVDPLLVNAAQSARPGRGWWRNILDLYGAANVLVAEVRLQRLYPGGPARAHFTGRFGPDGDRLGGFDLTAKDSADIPRMMAEGVQRMDELYARALAAGVFVHDRSLDPPPPPPMIEEEVEEQLEQSAVTMTAVPLLVTAPDAPTLSAIIANIRGAGGVQSVSERSIALGGTSSLMVSYRGSVSQLRSALIARGWSVDEVGGFLRLSVARPAPAPAPGPTPPRPQPQPQPPPQPAPPAPTPPR